MLLLESDPAIFAQERSSVGVGAKVRHEYALLRKRVVADLADERTNARVDHLMAAEGGFAGEHSRTRRALVEAVGEMNDL